MMEWLHSLSFAVSVTTIATYPGVTLRSKESDCDTTVVGRDAWVSEMDPFCSRQTHGGTGARAPLKGERAHPHTPEPGSTRVDWLRARLSAVLVLS